MLGLKTTFKLLKEAGSQWLADKAPRLGAALAYYTVFSLAPLLIIAIAVAGLFFGREAVEGQLYGQIDHLVGAEGAQTIQEMVKNAYKPETGRLAAIFGIITLLIGATGLFGQLQDSLNTVWGVEREGAGVKAFIKDRLLSFSVVLGIGFLLLVSLFISAGLAAANEFASHLIPFPPWIMFVVNIAVSIGVITLLFAMMFKILPDVHMSWRNVWAGAFGTALFFTLGKLLIGLYLGNSSVASGYGAAGSVILILVWTYYSAQILLFGAEFTQVYATHAGSPIVPAENARWADNAPQGKKSSGGRSASAAQGGKVKQEQHKAASLQPQPLAAKIDVFKTPAAEPSTNPTYPLAAFSGALVAGLALGKKILRSRDVPTPADDQ